MCCSKNYSRTTVIFILSLTLTACGGGSSGSNNNTANDNNNDNNEPVDELAPALSINAPTNNPEYSTSQGSVTIGGMVSDNVAVTELSWVNENGGTGSIVVNENWEYTDIPLSVGSNRITVTARDAANNVTTAAINVEYAIQDNTPPAISITSPNDGNPYQTDLNRVSIAGTTSDDIGVTRVSWRTSRGKSG
ncbi:MAG: hypothetical protein PVJ39_10675, partial [Gammaproteobacteria bacterium]